MQTIRPTRLDKHLRALTEDIGVRLAGSPAEEAAAVYAAEAFRDVGAAVSVEAFDVQRRQVEEECLEICIDGRWQAFPCSLFSNTPGTDGARIRAPLVFFAPQTDHAGDLSALTGKAVVHLGSHIESREAYARLMRARPAFMLFVDVRHPGTTALADGMFPAYTSALGAVPTVNVAFMDAWEWKRRGAAEARLRVVGGMTDGTSQNVVAELPGDGEDDGILFVGGHHDTQAASVGADDNATGVAGLIELARVLAPRPRRRSIRLISFGAEEQLSVGSATYVRRHREELTARGRFMFNLDAYGSLMGWNELVCNGPPSLPSALRPTFERGGTWLRILDDIVPYADHFPFVAAGVPGVWLGRVNCTAGRFFHHRPDDDISRVCTRTMADLLDATAVVLDGFATSPDLPFSGPVPAAQARQVEAYWTDLFGGWEG